MSGCHLPINYSLENKQCKCVHCLDKRIEKIENYIALEDRITSSNVLIRLALLEDKFKKVVFHPIETNAQKCPVCDGSGKDRTVLLSMPPKHPDCHACSGKGIVWK